MPPIPRQSDRGSDHKHSSPSSVNAAVRSVGDVMRRSKCAGVMQEVSELTWLLFTKGGPIEGVWYYDLTGAKAGKRAPLTIDRLDEFFRLLPHHGTPAGDSGRSWTVVG